MPPKRFSVAVIVGFFSAILAAGCGARPVPTKGIVTFNGKPLANATVMFVAQDSEGQNATGFTDTDGAFELTTTNMKDGALPGTYKVTVHHSETIEVPKGLKTAEEIQMAMADARPKRKTAVAIPEKYTRADQTPLEFRVPDNGELKIELRGD